MNIKKLYMITIPLVVVIITVISITLWQFISFGFLEIQEASRSYQKNDNVKILQEKEKPYENTSVQYGVEKKELLASKIDELVKSQVCQF